MDVNTHLVDKNVCTNALLKNKALWKKKSQRRIKKSLKEPKVIPTKYFYARRFDEGENYQNSMSIMSTLRLQRKNYSRIWTVYQTRSEIEYPTSVRLWKTATNYKHNQNLWQTHLHEAKDTLRDTKKIGTTFIWIRDRCFNDTTYRKSKLVTNWPFTWMRYLGHIAQIDFVYKAS